MDVWQGHPHRDEVLTTLKRVREELADLRGRVLEYNTEHPAPNQFDAVVFYAGQCVTHESLERTPEESPPFHDPSAPSENL